MKQRLFNIVVALSLALCVAAAVLWAQSYLATKAGPGLVASWSHGQTKWFVWAHSGHFGVSRENNGLIIVDWDSMTVERLWQTPLFIYARYRIRSAPAQSGGYVAVECWLVCGVAAIVPAARLPFLLRMRRQRRIASGLCPRCGYDLRATPDRCPECGNVIAKTATAAARS